MQGIGPTRPLRLLIRLPGETPQRRNVLHHLTVGIRHPCPRVGHLDERAIAPLAPPQGFLGPLAFGDVHQEADNPDDIALRIAVRDFVRLEPALLGRRLHRLDNVGFRLAGADDLLIVPPVGFRLIARIKVRDRPAFQLLPGHSHDMGERSVHRRKRFSLSL